MDTPKFLQPILASLNEHILKKIQICISDAAHAAKRNGQSYFLRDLFQYNHIGHGVKWDEFHGVHKYRIPVAWVDGDTDLLHTDREQRRELLEKQKPWILEACKKAVIDDYENYIRGVETFCNQPIYTGPIAILEQYDPETGLMTEIFRAKLATWQAIKDGASVVAMTSAAKEAVADLDRGRISSYLRRTLAAVLLDAPTPTGDQRAQDVIDALARVLRHNNQRGDIKIRIQ